MELLQGVQEMVSSERIHTESVYVKVINVA